jgi:hypothetical protein
MRKLLTIAVVALSAALGAAGSGDAQVRIKPYAGQTLKAPPIKTPRVQPVKPRLNVLPPSAAVMRALRAVPQAKPLGVKLRNQTYIVRLKSGGTITQVGVDSVTGAVTSID